MQPGVPEPPRAPVAPREEPPAATRERPEPDAPPPPDRDKRIERYPDR